ncbi:MAG: M48 family peptidase [Deltaproteobacteria bacterium]|nr:MAG: M48 family peptidase [Deltaproteobacteria bacterium]
MTHDSVTLDRVEIPYSYKLSKRRTLAIQVYPDLTVVVRAPLGTNTSEIRQQVIKRGSWIQKVWQKFELNPPKQAPLRYVGGENHFYMGRQYRLRIEHGGEDSVKCLRGHLHVSSRQEPSPEVVKPLLEGWYRERAHHVFRERLAECFKGASFKGVESPSLHIRKMKTRWGSCSSKGRINLNLELIKAPKECIDYVVMHELCHIKVPSHGPKFWRLMAKFMPDYEERKRRLKEFAGV